MQTDSSSSQPRQGYSQSPNLPDALFDERLARRRVLLKGLGRGSAALALIVPIQTLAAPTIIDGTQKFCTVSGAQSASASHVVDGFNTCKGFKPQHYTSDNWPAAFLVNGVTVSKDSLFGRVFVGSSNLANNTLLDIISNHLDSIEVVWVTALLNARVSELNTTILYFPYTPLEVISFYPNAAAYSFFHDYMQTVT